MLSPRGGLRPSLSCAVAWFSSGTNAVLSRLAVAGLALSCCLVLVLLAQLGMTVYQFTAVPVWYFCNFCIIAFPFLSLFRYDNLSASYARKFWLSLLALSLLVSSFECIIVHMFQRSWSWVIGNTMFVLIGSCGLPLYFGTKRRTPVTLDGAEGGSGMHVDAMLPREHVDPLLKAERARALEGLVSGGLFAYRPGLEKQTTDAGFVAAASVLVGLFIVWIGYLAPSGGSYWGYVYLCLPFQVGVVLLDAHKNLRFNFSYLIFYVCVAVRIPDFLSGILLHFFHNMADYVSTNRPDYIAVCKVALTTSFIIVMNLFLQMLYRVVANMSTANSYTAFLFIGQLYFYFLWYLLLGTDGDLDFVYWAMLIISNVNYVMINTRAYCDDCLSRLGCVKSCLVAQRGAAARAARARDARTRIGPASLSAAERAAGALVGSARSRRLRASSLADDGEPADPEERKYLIFIVKLAEQDNLADTVALVMVPSLITAFSWLGSPIRDVIITNPTNLWLRYLTMGIARMMSARFADAVFAWKIGIGAQHRGHSCMSKWGHAWHVSQAAYPPAPPRPPPGPLPLAAAPAPPPLTAAFSLALVPDAGLPIHAVHPQAQGMRPDAGGPHYEGV